MAETLDILLEEKRLFNYDLLCETMPDNKETSPVGRFIKYRDIGADFDPDNSSQLLRDICDRLWKDLCSKWFMQNNDGKILFDTMTSVQYIINSAMQLKKVMEIEEFKDCKLTKNQRYSKNYMINVYNENSVFMEKLFEEYELDKLLRVYHTVGNHCPVPRFFNAARSGYNNSEHDFWDLTLMKIKEYYDCNKSTEKVSRIIGDELLHHSGNAIACKEWLDFFGNWKTFVDANFFNVYVDNNDNVRPFWEGHSWENTSLPQDKDELITAVNEIIDRILCRGKQIQLELNKKT